RRRQGQREAAQLMDADVERHTRAQGRLFENLGKCFPAQRRRVRFRNRFDPASHIQKAPDLLRSEVLDGKEVVHFAPTSATSAFFAAVNSVRISTRPGLVSSSAS